MKTAACGYLITLVVGKAYTAHCSKQMPVSQAAQLLSACMMDGGLLQHWLARIQGNTYVHTEHISGCNSIEFLFVQYSAAKTP
jgi:hypothetical protein